MIRVLIANDHVILRKGLKQILLEQPALFGVGEAESGEDVVEKLKSGHWDLVILDMGLVECGTLDIVKRIKSQYPRLPVVLFSMDGGETYAVRALRAGASAYITRETVPQELILALQKVGRGERYVSPSLAERLAFDLVSESGKPAHESLSDREFQILCMIASGKTISDIAEQLYLSVKTVSTHRSRILEKMKMRNNAELIIYSIQNGLIGTLKAAQNGDADKPSSPRLPAAGTRR